MAQQLYRSHGRRSRQPRRSRTRQSQRSTIRGWRQISICRRSALPATPIMFPGTNNMWVNVGKSQFHLPTGDPNVLRGHVGLVVPSLEELCERLGEAKKKLADTKFDCKQHNAYVEATCPWGNKFRLYEPDEERFGAINLGMPYVEFTVPEGTADGIARFYREIFYAPACVKKNGEGRAAHVKRRPQAGADLPRDRPENPGIRRPSPAGLCPGILGPA